MQPPYTYKTLTETLREQPDLVTAMSGVLWSDALFTRGAWRHAIRDWLFRLNGPALTETWAVLWACYLHPATDEEIDEYVRRGIDKPVELATRDFQFRRRPTIARCIFTASSRNLWQTEKAAFETLMRLPEGDGQRIL